MVALPFHKGRRPYEQIAFQFSHHIVRHENADAEHAGEWICAERGKFPNFDFVRALKKELELDRGTVLRYANHENIVLCQIYRQLLDSTQGAVPDKDELCAWIRTIAKPTGRLGDAWPDAGRMVDMLDVLKRNYFDPAMGGSNSIKALLPAVLASSPYLQKKYPGVTDPYASLPRVLEGFDRNKLDALFFDEADEIHDGGAAMMAYMKMQFGEMTDAERKSTVGALLSYCKTDTLAMVMVWEAWRHL